MHADYVFQIEIGICRFEVPQQHGRGHVLALSATVHCSFEVHLQRGQQEIQTNISFKDTAPNDGRRDGLN